MCNSHAGFSFMPLTPEILQILSSGSFAALFVWLLYETRRDARELLIRSNAREDRLMLELHVLSESYRDIARFILKEQFKP